jgi:hypothetical protein
MILERWSPIPRQMRRRTQRKGFRCCGQLDPQPESSHFKPFRDNQRSPGATELVLLTGSQGRNTRSSASSASFPPTKTPITVSPDSLTATGSSGSANNNRTENDNYEDQISEPPLEKKATRKPKAPEKEAATWNEVGLSRYPLAGEDIGPSLMQDTTCHYSRDIRQQMCDMFDEERGYRGINRPLSDTAYGSSGLALDADKDMSGVVRLFDGCVLDSVTTFVVITNPPTKPDTGSSSHISLVQQTLQAENEESQASFHFILVVQQIMLGKKFRDRLRGHQLSNLSIPSWTNRILLARSLSKRSSILAADSIEM